MKHIAIFTSTTATVEELTAAYALVDYLSDQKGSRLDRRSGQLIQSINAFVVKSSDDRLDPRARMIVSEFGYSYSKDIQSICFTADVKIAIGVRSFSELGEQKGAMWAEWMEAETYFLRPGKHTVQKRFGGLLQKPARERTTCTEMVYDYITEDDARAIHYNNISELLYLGLYWVTRGFRENMELDRFDIIRRLQAAGANMYDVPRVRALLEHPTELNVQRYGKLLSESVETAYTLMAHASLRDEEDGLMFMEHLIQDTTKDIIVLHGELASTPETGYVYLYVRKTEEGSRDARNLLVSLSSLNHGTVKTDANNPKIAYATVKLDQTSVASILKTHIVDVPHGTVIRH